ncbi:Hypothetical predicted protein [Olea europaea subsp. europaea]|uniref:Uncharacterized protein n=1 Tax=Olea europaea subsp. europaea TaxID=158383 RepID=A0A8S0RSQ6_OLEEU|nr:Hypothetical predicted protein [Olea europaea subsp. europaea]
MFQDITTLLLDPKAFKDTIDLFVERYKDQLKLMLLQAFLEVNIVVYGGMLVSYYGRVKSNSDSLVKLSRFCPSHAVLENSSIHIHKMPQWPTSGGSLPKILHPLMLMLKLIVQFLLLLWYICMKIPVPDVFMVQVTVLENSSMYVLLPSTGVAVEFASQYRRSNLHNQIVNGKYKLWSHGMFCTHSFALE